MLSPVYVGIDSRCRRGKQLPLCFVSSRDVVQPLEIPKRLSRLVPRGLGNREIAEPSPFRDAALQTAKAITQIAREMGWCIERIAIDSPAAPPRVATRLSEAALGSSGLSYFRTPAAPEWPHIREKCIRHLHAGGSASTLPHANKIWMLFGFELFSSLRGCFNGETIEVYPFAIVRALLPTCGHKRTEQGYQDQLRAIAARTGWEPPQLDSRLKETVRGSRDDRLDAFMAAWIASLPAASRRAFGDATQPDDAIWVPADN